MPDNTPDDEPPTPVKSEELRRRIAQINELKNKHLPRLKEYEQKLSICGDRNSYSKTDPDATFMRMKEDAMNNGQLKPGYNLQISTENQLITSFYFYPNRNDTVTLPSFLSLHQSRYGRMPNKAIADAGCGSEENYAFMEGHGITAFVKYNYFYKDLKRSHKIPIKTPLPVLFV